MEATSWQVKLSSLKDRNLYAFDNSLFCDIEFSVLDTNGDKVTIPAHKYVLAISSPVFEAMFCGELADTGPTIDLPDCTKEGLQQTLRYVYSDEVNLTGSNVLEVLSLAEKYMLPFLKEKCEEYLEKQLQPEDVFHVLPQIRNEKVEQHCWDMVDGHTERAVSSESFLHISKDMLCRVLRRETISIDEVVLFEAVEKWALNKIQEKGLEGNRKNKRAVLGEDVIKLIRFPLMSEVLFIKEVLPSGILKMNEVTEIMQYHKKISLTPGAFTATKRRSLRKLIIPNSRFSSNGSGIWNYNNSHPDAIDFNVNKRVSLIGVRCFGNRDSKYTVHLTLYKNTQSIATVRSLAISTESVQTNGYYGYTVALDNPVDLDPDVRYTIEATIEGPSSCGGDGGSSLIKGEDSLVITYMNSVKSANGTSVNSGQFPTLILKEF